MKAVKEIMKTPAKSVVKSETIQSAAKTMYKSNIGFLPVVDENEKVVGTITDRDIALAIGKNSKPSQEIKVHEVMNSTIHTIKAEDDTAAALKLMRTKQVGRLPVVDSENRLKGIVSLMGIARTVKNDAKKEEVEYEGTENILNTLHSLAERNQKAEVVEEAAE
jgi:CBS domain-containing protein